MPTACVSIIKRLTLLETAIGAGLNSRTVQQLTRWVEKDMKNKFATSRTTRQSMRRALILASRLSDSDTNSGPLVPRGARLNRNYQQALQQYPPRVSTN